MPLDALLEGRALRHLVGQMPFPVDLPHLLACSDSLQKREKPVQEVAQALPSLLVDQLSVLVEQRGGARHVQRSGVAERLYEEQDLAQL